MPIVGNAEIPSDSVQASISVSARCLVVRTAIQRELTADGLVLRPASYKSARERPAQDVHHDRQRRDTGEP
jgi:hypothetical protein